MKKIVAVLSVFAVCAAFSLNATAEEDGKPKWTIKEIMKGAMKSKLIDRVGRGQATEEEVKSLNEMMIALSKNTPKKGEADSWKKLTTALVKASKAAVDGDAGAGKLLIKAKNCKACHTPHK